MIGNELFCPESFFGQYEMLVREELSKELDGLKKLLGQLDKDCITRDLNLPPSAKGYTREDLLSGDTRQRRQVLAAAMYSDALWRLEGSHIMISIGLLNVAYSNLRTCLETLVTAFIVERMDSEAKNFLNFGNVNPKLIAKYIPSEYNEILIDMKKAFSNWGVHAKFDSIQISSLFAPRRLARWDAELPNAGKPLSLPTGFLEAARRCIKDAGNVAILFVFLMSNTIAR